MRLFLITFWSLTVMALGAAQAIAQGANADLAVSFTNTPSAVSLGQSFRVTISVVNLSAVYATNVVLTNVLPANATFMGAYVSRGSVNQAGGLLSCSFGQLFYNQTATLTFELKPTSLDALTNLATVSSDNPDSISTNNAATWVTTVTQARFFAVGRTHVGYNEPIMTLMTNNQVLVAGQHLGKTADLYNMTTRSFDLPVGSMVGVHEYGSGTLLANGLVLLAGGANGTSAKTAEIYNPATQLFHQVGNMLVYSYSHMATLQPDGTVLFCSSALATNELFNPVTETFSLAPTRQCPYNGIYLSTGKFLYFGYGRGYLYDTNTGTSVAASPFLQFRTYHTATLLPNGKVLIAGGQGPGGSGGLSSAEIYDPATDTFTWTANLTSPRQSHSACLLPDGTVLLAGGSGAQYTGSFLDTAEVYDPNGAPSVPGILANDASVLEGNSGTNFLNFNISLTTASTFPVTVQYATTGGTANANPFGVGTPDNVAVTGTVTFPPGSTNQVVQVPVLGDTILEPDETVFLNLSVPTQAWIARATANGTILNDDATPTLSIAPVSVIEGDSGLSNAVFNVSLSSQSLTSVTVNYFTSDQTAQAGSDYLQTTGTLTFSPGVTNQTIAVPVIGDLAPEPDETFAVTLTNAQNAIIAVSDAAGTILNDDGIPGRLHHFDWTTIPDPQTQTIGFPVTITARDYYGAVATNLPWPVRLSALTTNVLATNLDFEVPSLGPWVPFDYTGLGHPFQLVQYDVAGLGQPSTAIRGIAGGGTNGVSQNIWLAGGIPYTFSVNVAALSIAYDMSCYGAGVYLQVGPTNVVWGTPGFCGSGSASATLKLVYTPPTNGFYPLQIFASRSYYYGDSLVIYADDVQISNPLISPIVTTNFINGVWSGSVSALQYGTNVSLLANDGAGHKGTSNPFDILGTTDLSLSGSSQILGTAPLRTGMQFALSLSVSNRGPAAAANVFVSSPLPTNVSFVSASNSLGSVSNNLGVLQWAIGFLPIGGSATATITLQANVQGDITNVFNASSSITELNPGDNSLALTNQISPPLMALASASASEASAASTGMVFSVTLSGPCGQAIAVNYTTSDGSGTNGIDYIGTNGVINFAPGVTNGSIRVFAIDNILSQPNRTFTLSLTNPVNVVLSNTNATGTIIDDDPPPVAWIYDTALLEGDSGITNARFNLALSKPAISNVTVAFRTQDGTASSTNDYAAQNSSVIFPAGTTNATILVPVNGDTVNETDETFFVNLTSASNATLGTNLAVCTIINNDAVPGRLDHFVFNAVPSPVFTNRPFSITLKAVDYLGATASNYSGAAVLTAQTGQYYSNYFQADFEDGGLIGWTNTLSPGLLASNVTDWSAGGQNSLRLTGKAAQSGTSFSLRHAISNSLPTGISFNVRAAQTNALCGRFTGVGNGVYTPFDFYMNRDGRIGLNSGNTFYGVPYFSNQWYHVDIQLDWTRHVSSLRLDGALIATNVPFVSSGPYMDTIALQNTDTGTAWFDDISVFSQTYTNLSVTPGNLAGFSAGVWTGNVTIPLIATNAYFTVTDNNQHVGTSSNFDVLPFNPRLTLPPMVVEGVGAVPASVSIPFALPQQTQISLTSSLPARITVPSSVTIPAGQTSVGFQLTIIDDALLNGSQLATISARGTNLASSSAVVEVDDNETAALSLVVPATAAENTGTLLSAGHLNSSAAATRNMSVTLSSSDPSSVIVQPTVILPIGATSAVFNVTLADNQKIDGSRSVAISASLANWTPATNFILVTDNENTNLRLSGPAQVNEGPAPVSYTVSISGSLTTNLTVALVSTDTNRLLAPASATIAAGLTSVSFPATIVDDTNYNGSGTVVISGTASGFTSVSTNVQVFDNELHHFSFSAISSPQTSTVPFNITVSARDIFDGPIPSYNGQVTLNGAGLAAGIVLSTNNVALSGGQWNGNIAIFTDNTNVALQASNANGISGQSSSFSLVPPVAYLANVNAADLVSSAASQRLWALVATNNTLVPIDPQKYLVETGVPAGTGATRLASSGDGRYAHIGRGQFVSRFDTQTRAVDLTWSNQGYSVDDFAAVPGNSDSIAVSWMQPGYSPRGRGTQIYDGGVPRIPGGFGAGNAIKFAESPTRLYGYNNETTGFQFNLLTVGATNVILDRTVSLMQYFGANFTTVGPYIFATTGQIADPERGIFVGGSTVTPVVGDSASGRFFKFEATPGRLVTYDLATLLPIATLPLTGVSNAAGRMVRWGTDGLAFQANTAQVAILHSSTVPTGSPTELSLTASSPMLHGTTSNTFSCVLTVSNIGPNPATNVILAQLLPANATLTGVTLSSGTFSNVPNGLVCTFNTLGSGAQATANLTFLGGSPGLALLTASATSATTETNLTNNVLKIPVSVESSPPADSITQIQQVISDLAWNPALGRIYASVPNSQVAFGSSLLSFDPLTGAFDQPIATGIQPNRLAVSSNGQYVYVGLDGESSIQRVDASNHIADLKFPTGFDYVSDMAVLPDNPHTVVATVHSTLVVYDDGVQRSNVIGATEYNQPYFLAVASPSNCFSTYPTGFRKITLDAGGANLISDTRNTVVTYPDWEIKYGAKRLFTPGGRVFDPFAGTNIATVPYSGLVAPDESDGRVFYLTGSGSTWTLNALNITNLQLMGSLTIGNISGSPARLIRWGTDGLAFRTTGGQIFLVRTIFADDQNLNGLPDSWEQKYFGSLNAPGNGPGDDPDGDGFTNLQEYHLGLNPLQSDALRFSNVQMLSGGGMQLSVLGNLNQSYALQVSTNLYDWTAILEFTCTNRPMVITDISGTNSARRFYRVAPQSAVPGLKLRF